MQEYLDETFKNKTEIEKAEYENCQFIDCNFEKANISNSVFIDCIFENCNLSNTVSQNASLKTVDFKNCKMLGFVFSDCNEFLMSVSFTDCQLNYASFYKLSIKNTKFENCNLQEVDFTETDLTSSKFNNCELNRAVFQNTNLQKADFRSSYNYSINPNENRIKNAKFSLEGVRGLLDVFGVEIE